MPLANRMYDHFYDKAQRTKVESLSIGLGYTAVTTDDGGIGLAYTSLNPTGCCSMNKGYRDYEGEKASELLAEIISPDPLHRSMGLALINALNYSKACELSEDESDGYWMDSFGVAPKSRVAMVGLFRPLLKIFQERSVLVEVIDTSHSLGNKTHFYSLLKNWAQVLVLTSTSILNDTTVEILNELGPNVKVVMIGPSTPMVPELFRDLPVHMLAGTVPVDKASVLKAVRHGVGTPVIHRFSRKVYLPLL